MYFTKNHPLKSLTTRGLALLLALACFPALNGQLLAEELQVLNTFDSCNVAIGDEVAYMAAGNNGIVIVNLQTLELAGTISPPAGSGSVDDISVDDGLLFTLDGVSPGRLSVFSIADPFQPTLASSPTPVNVGPFAGVSAANGRVVVSGGTGLLSAFTYDENGSLSNSMSTIDLGIGQPDVLISNDGDVAYVSTDFVGLVDGEPFGIAVVDLTNVPGPISILDRVGIDGAGFTPGFASPANFPVESAIQDNTLYVASGNGVSVFDVSNPSSVQTITEIPLALNPVNVDVLDGELFVVSNSPTSTLTVIDVVDPMSPIIETANLPAAGQPLGVAATDGVVVVADGELGVVVCSSPLVLGDLNGDGSVNLLDVNPFIEVLGDGGFDPAADINGDGVVNLLDVEGFIDLLSA